MSELVEQRFGFVQAEQSRSVASGRREVGYDRHDRRDALSVGRVPLGPECVAPCSGLLALARVQVEVEDAQMRVVLVENLVCQALLMIDRDRHGAESQSPEPVAEHENALLDIVERQVRLEGLFVEIVFRLAKPFGVVPPVPRGERAVAGFGRLDRLHFGELLAGQFQRRFPESVEHLVYSLGRRGQRTVELERCVRRIAEQGGLLGAQPDDPLDDPRVVVVAAVGSPVQIAPVEPLAQVAVFGVGQERNQAGFAEREDVFPLHTPGLGLGRRRIDHVVGQAGRLLEAVEHEREVLVLCQQVIAEADAECRQFRVDLAQPFLAAGRKTGSGAHEVFVREFRQTFLLGRERQRVELLVDSLHPFEKLFVQVYVVPMGRYRRRYFQIGLLHRLVVVGCGDQREGRVDPVERFPAPVERGDRIFEIRGRRVRCDRVDFLLVTDNGLLDGRLVMAYFDLVERRNLVGRVPRGEQRIDLRLFVAAA